MLGCRVCISSNLLKKGKLFSKVIVFKVRVHAVLHPLQNLISSDPFIFMNLLRDAMIPLCGFTFHFPIKKMTENVFMFLGHLTLFLCEVPFKVFCPKFYWLSFSSGFTGVTYILDYILWILDYFPGVTNIFTQVVSYTLAL